MTDLRIRVMSTRTDSAESCPLVRFDHSFCIGDFMKDTKLEMPHSAQTELREKKREMKSRQKPQK